MIKFYIYNSKGVLIDEGETNVKNIGYITMPLATNNCRVILESVDYKERTQHESKRIN